MVLYMKRNYFSYNFDYFCLYKSLEHSLVQAFNNGQMQSIVVPIQREVPFRQLPC
jgi:hypothetical protein